jgi:hypothetical protein
MAFKAKRDAERGQMESDVVALLRVCSIGESSRRIAVSTNADVKALLPGVQEYEKDGP